MFDTLISFIGKLGNSYVDLAKEIWRQCGATLLSTWAVLSAIIGWIYWTWDTLGGMAGQLSAFIDAITFPTLSASAPGTITYALNLANTFFPVQEGTVFISSWFQLSLALTGYRLIKSWIPTLS